MVAQITGSYADILLEANRPRWPARVDRLTEADATLDKVRHYWRLVYDWRWITLGQYEHGSRLVAELGRFLGDWRKKTPVATALAVRV